MRTVLVLAFLVCVAFAKIIEGEYLFSFHETAGFHEREAFKSQLLASEDHQLLNEWNIGSFHGVVGQVSERFVEFARSHPAIDIIEPNQVQSISQSCLQQNSPIWNLDRLGSADDEGSYNYLYNGDSVDVYIVDTGIRITHNEFQGRAIQGPNFTDDGVVGDCNGHGTHVAGTVAGVTYGVAKVATVYEVKVLNCDGNGNSDWTIRGLQFVFETIPERQRRGVVNMSLGGGYSAILNKAVTELVTAGIPVVVAAGNEDVDCTGSSPASAAAAITVGATDEQDVRSTFSNFGQPVDIFAPGTNILSAGYEGDDELATKSGTSMASPHVAGVVALSLDEHPDWTPAQVLTDLRNKADLSDHFQIIDLNCGGRKSCTRTVNRLLYSTCISDAIEIPVDP